MLEGRKLPEGDEMVHLAEGKGESKIKPEENAKGQKGGLSEQINLIHTAPKILQTVILSVLY